MAIRSDLQNKAAKIGSTMTPKVAPSNQYGEQAKLMRGMKDVPTGPSPTSVVQQPKGPKPGAIVDLLAPTMSPNEPITAGASFGPGLTPMQAGIPMMGAQNNAVNELRNISRLYPDSGISDLLDKYGE